MSDILCVTNRALCRGDFLRRLERIAAAGCAGILLREKDLPPAEYRDLARRVMALCARYDTPCILHGFAPVAAQLGARALHLPLPALQALPEGERARFAVLGASCHSVDQARQAQALGCTYLTAGHVFATGCKPGLPPRGLDFLRDVCRVSSVPVWAIGGVRPDNFAAVRAAGARGGCVMGALMTCEDPAALLAAFDRAAR